MKKDVMKEIEKIKNEIAVDEEPSALKESFSGNRGSQAGFLYKNYEKLGKLYDKISEKKEALSAYKLAEKWGKIYVSLEINYNRGEKTPRR